MRGAKLRLLTSPFLSGVYNENSSLKIKIETIIWPEI